MERARVVRNIGLGVLVFVVMSLVAGTIVGTGLVRRAWPQTSGSIALEGLGADVTVIRDARGVPDIYASNAVDLFRAQGFVAAQDRFFEMDLRRHITAGRLAELVGKAGLDTDKVVRTMGWRKVAEEELPRLAPATRRYLSAYADGVNDYLATSGDPSNFALEYTILATQLPDYRVEKWTALDSLSWLKAMAWDLRSNVDAELTRARLSGIMDSAALAWLYPAYPSALHEPILSEADWQPGRAASATPPALTSGPAVTVPGPPQPSRPRAPGRRPRSTAPRSRWTASRPCWGPARGWAPTPGSWVRAGRRPGNRCWPTTRTWGSLCLASGTRSACIAAPSRRTARST